MKTAIGRSFGCPLWTVWRWHFNQPLCHKCRGCLVTNRGSVVRMEPTSGLEPLTCRLRNTVCLSLFKHCVLLDARRPELIEAWYAVMKCVRIADLSTRCKV